MERNRMYDLSNIIITQIRPPTVVRSAKGRKQQMDNRSNFGLSLCISGQITYTMNGKTYISNQNNAIILPKNGTYTLFGDKEGLFPVINFDCNGFHCDEILVIPLENPQTCVKDFEVLKSLFLYQESHLKIYSTFYELLSKVFSSNISKHTPIQSTIQYIEKNISSTELSNDVLAKNLGVSEVYLRKLFLSYLHVTPKQYILDIRIRKAKQLLVDTPFSITAIAQDCGFSSVYHFCRCFKQRTGKTPTQYAAENKTYQI